jgi:hypothetical protein
VLSDAVGHDLWFDRAGARVIGSRGRVFDLQDPSPPLTQLGTLGTGVRSLDQSSASGRIAVVPFANVPLGAAMIRLYDDATYALLGSQSLPSFVVQGRQVSSRGLFVFFSDDGSVIYTLVAAISDEPLAARYGLARMPTFE